MEKAELVFIPFPGIGHLISTVEIAKLLTRRDHRLSVTILVIKFPFDFKDGATTESLAASITEQPIRFVYLPHLQFTFSGLGSLSAFITSHIPLVIDAVHELTRSDSVRLAGFVMDMFCTTMIDAANEFGVPSYVFFTSGAAFLGFMLHHQFLHDHQGLDLAEFKDSDAALEVPSYANSVPGKVFPPGIFDKEDGGTEIMMQAARRFRESKGILVNTFVELEWHAIDSFSRGATAMPPVYPVGPILNTQLQSGGTQSNTDVILSWLDDQPQSSVMFLCFGSMGGFGREQVKEIARGLEQSGCRFLWSLRQAPQKGKMGSSSDYANFDEILPEGFLDRTARVGKVIGWAPQVAILAHPAVGGFVSHCGWNSILESIWYGVPIASWPMDAEQQLNAFLMIKDLELAVEIKMDYQIGKDYVVSAQDIENGVKHLMENDGEQRKKMKKMQEKSRKAATEGGSSYSYWGNFIEAMMNNIS